MVLFTVLPKAQALYNAQGSAVWNPAHSAFQLKLKCDGNMNGLYSIAMGPWVKEPWMAMDEGMKDGWRYFFIHTIAFGVYS